MLFPMAAQVVKATDHSKHATTPSKLTYHQLSPIYTNRVINSKRRPSGSITNLQVSKKAKVSTQLTRVITLFEAVMLAMNGAYVRAKQSERRMPCALQQQCLM